MEKNPSTGSKNYQWGREAEAIAAEYFLRRGYTIRERNWRPGSSGLEIDLITELDNTIIFVEVKARTGDWESAEDAVDDKKILRLCRAADSYLSGAVDYDAEYRFDIFTVTGNSLSYKVSHIEDAFMPPLTTL